MSAAEKTEYRGISKVDGWLFSWNYSPEHPVIGHQRQWPELRITAGQVIRVQFLDGHGQTPPPGFDLVGIIKDDSGKRHVITMSPWKTEVPLAG